jgi:hypothetical protein
MHKFLSKAPLIVVACALCAAGTPASVGAAQTEAPAETAKAKKAKDSKKICLKTDGTGSRMAMQVCQTAEKWKRDGVDVTSKD